MFNKILIANRGEIACRIIRTAHDMGIQCVAIYSEADRNAMHVAMADKAYCIGPAPSTESYLKIDTIIETALKSGVQGIHPGYGFLAENADFSRACDEAGITFIGPPASAIEAMGSKAAAKDIMLDADVPMVQGYHGENQDPDFLKNFADKIGYPILLKPSAGGGGKGMRIVRSGKEFDSSLDSAKREAKASFGDEAMLIEKYLTRPRHVEIQVFADTHGNAIYLAERDCSVQRRHQKIIEEAPAPGLSDETRKSMGATAVKAAKAIGYVGAGTVEFLYDEDGSFYFMEMNTRLQVEHPVTEFITGLDLVEWQLLVASGMPLPLKQEEVTVNGAAIEVRIYAEDPDNEFLPSTGKLVYLRTPEENKHVRVDTGVRENDEVSVYYDPMIAKLIVWDENRDLAIQRMDSALQNYRISGLKTNVSFLSSVINSEPFGRGDVETGFIERHYDSLFKDIPTDEDAPALTALYILLKKSKTGAMEALATCDPYSPWNFFSAWRLNDNPVYIIKLLNDGREITISADLKGKYYQLKFEGKDIRASGHLSGDTLIASLDNRKFDVAIAEHLNQITVFNKRLRSEFHSVEEQYADLAHDQDDGGLTAPMNGTIVAVLTEAGAKVKKGDGLIVLEAMKMEHKIMAPDDGTVTDVFFKVGDLVKEGTELIAFKADGDQESA